MTKIVVAAFTVLFVTSVVLIATAVVLIEQREYHDSGSPVVEEYKHQPPYDPTKYRL